MNIQYLEQLCRYNTVPITEVGDIVGKYKQIPSNHQHISRLKKLIHNKTPYLLNADIIVGDYHLSLKVQKQQELKILLDHKTRLKNLQNTLSVRSYVKGLPLRKVDNYKNQIVTLMDKMCVINHRYKKPESIENNIKIGNPYTLFDTFAMRLVPRQASDLLKVIYIFEKEFKEQILFKINFYSWNETQLKDRLRKNSEHYRGIHYFFKIDDYVMEIQIRLKSIDLWARLSHDTIYKKIIPIDEKSIYSLDEFGAIANVVDYYDLFKAGNIG